MFTREIGETFTFDGDTYVVEEASVRDTCIGCDLLWVIGRDSICTSQYCFTHRGFCSAYGRTDEKDVIFKRIK